MRFPKLRIYNARKRKTIPVALLSFDPTTYQTVPIGTPTYDPETHATYLLKTQRITEKYPWDDLEGDDFDVHDWMSEYLGFTCNPRIEHDDPAMKFDWADYADTAKHAHEDLKLQREILDARKGRE